MSDRPRVFVSAVSKELKSARQVVANTLSSQGYEPEFVEVFSAEQGDIHKMLRRRIDSCEGLIQLVGEQFGQGPVNPATDDNAVSYTQFELLHARERGMKVWPILLKEGFTTQPNDEPEAHRLNQQRYRTSLRVNAATGGTPSELFLEASNQTELENRVLKLRDELEVLRVRWRKQQRRMSVFLAATAVGVLLLLGLVLLVRRDTDQTLDTTNRVETKLDQTQLALEEVVRRLPAENQAGGDSERSAIFKDREKRYGLPPGTIERELPGFAKRLSVDNSVAPSRRALGAYASGDYALAEQLARDAASLAEKQTPPDRRERLQALELAGRAASARKDFRQALEFFAEAAKLAAKSTDPAEYARIQLAIAFIRTNSGNLSLGQSRVPSRHPSNSVDTLTNWVKNAATTDSLSENTLDQSQENLSSVSSQSPEARPTDELVSTGAVSGSTNVLPGALPIDSRLPAAGGGKLEPPKRDPRDVVAEHSSVAMRMLSEGKAKEAESESRKAVALSMTNYGAENLITLSNRTLLATALAEQDRPVEAYVEHDTVFRSRRLQLGSNHVDTLLSQNGVASALYDQRRYAEAERVYRVMVEIYTKLEGPTQTNTLFHRTRVGDALHRRGFFAEAEAEHRDVLGIREKELGEKHPDTLKSRKKLVEALDAQFRAADAEEHVRKLLKIYQEESGDDGINTLNARESLGKLLYAQGDQAKYAEAVDEFRKVLKIRERLPVANDLDILRVRKFLAMALDALNKHLEAEREYVEIVASRQEKQGQNHPEALAAMRDLARYLELRSRLADAIEWAGKAAQGAQITLGPTNQVTKEYMQYEQKLKGKR